MKMKMKMRKRFMKLKHFGMRSEHHTGMSDSEGIIAAMRCERGFHDHHRHHHSLGSHGSPWARFNAVGFHGRRFPKHHFDGHGFCKQKFHDHHDKCKPKDHDHHERELHGIDHRGHGHFCSVGQHGKGHHGHLCSVGQHGKGHHGHLCSVGQHGKGHHGHFCSVGQHGKGRHGCGHFCSLGQHEDRQDAEGNNQDTNVPESPKDTPAPNGGGYCKRKFHDHHGKCKPRMHDLHHKCMPKNHDHHERGHHGKGPRGRGHFYRLGHYGNGHPCCGHLCSLGQHEEDRQEAESDNQVANVPERSIEEPAPNEGEGEPSTSKE